MYVSDEQRRPEGCLGGRGGNRISTRVLNPTRFNSPNRIPAHADRRTCRTGPGRFAAQATRRSPSRQTPTTACRAHGCRTTDTPGRSNRGPATRSDDDSPGTRIRRAAYHKNTRMRCSAEPAGSRVRRSARLPPADTAALQGLGRHHARPNGRGPARRRSRRSLRTRQPPTRRQARAFGFRPMVLIDKTTPEAV